VDVSRINRVVPKFDVQNAGASASIILLDGCGTLIAI
jgi:hypothetical protein